ncbi:septal ring lytic transglycosylase RlpA family protein [Roseomonas harenae]|uniref:septal ring lytic transglycosylase RlpA family protein n=1 Tax=Muricoccus harenae TaxID=2692566 RepID=UPI0038B42F2D
MPVVRSRRPHRVQRGHASIYASQLAGRRMADGSRFDPRSDTVASKTLPLGSRARVTNLRNGRSVTVRVRDRGPHRRQRILDVSPGVARRLGMPSTGTAMVSVAPIAGPSVTSRAEAATPRRGRARR